MYKGVRWHERNGKWEARIFDSAAQKQVQPYHNLWIPYIAFTGLQMHLLRLACASLA